MKATLQDYMGSDETVADAARVSFQKKAVNYDNLANERLILYLAKHNHFSPFTHCFARIHCKAPIFVARQMAKHQVGFSWNEVSRRYVNENPEFYFPVEWRKKASDKKQGSSEEFKDNVVTYDLYNELKADMPDEFLRQLCQHADDLYRAFIRDGVCPEQARMLLPLNTYTEWVWSGSLMAWARMCNLRLKDDTQSETRELAQEIADQVGPLFPASWAALVHIGVK